MPPRRKTIAFRYMLISWGSLARWLFLATTVILMVLVVVTKNKGLLAWTGVSAGLLLLSCLVFFIEYPQVRCLMCGANLLRKLGCRPHGNAKRVLGNHVLRVTLKMARYPNFVTCPYCDGTFRLAGKSRRGDDVDHSTEWPEQSRQRGRRRVKR